jgi:hypothetical protein
MAKSTNFGVLSQIKPIEPIVNQDYYHVILLIDSSGSMLFPFLKDESNWNNDQSEDYKNAVKLSQEAMIEAHAKALSALRGSEHCNDCFLQVTQYTFNSAKRLLNEAEELSSQGFDHIIKISEQNYRPFNGTALYNTIHEALTLVYQKHLKEAFEQKHRVDKVTIGVITDGEDTVLTDSIMKRRKIEEIKNILKVLRGTTTYCHLVSSVLIGLTSKDFTKEKLNEVKEELTFTEAISIVQSDEKAIRRAFKLWSTDAAQF